MENNSILLKFLKLTVCCLVVILSLTAGFQTLYGQSPCDRISEIRILPFKGEFVDDNIYNALLKGGEAVIPCLIEKVIDTTKMPDPRQAPIYSKVTVGDVAIFVLGDIAKVDVVKFLPAKVQEEYKSEGIYAYFKFVDEDGNRRWLRDQLREWYKRKAGQVR